jgi:hypothetical protein
MFDDDAVAAFLSSDGGFSRLAYGNVIEPIPDRSNAAWRCRKHVDIALLDLKIGNPDISPVVAVICAAATHEITNLAARIMVDVVLDEAGDAELALHRQRESECLQGLRRKREGEEEQQSRKSLGQRRCALPHKICLARLQPF